jgi:K+-transporting ATPase KdpF subunit
MLPPGSFFFATERPAVYLRPTLNRSRYFQPVITARCLCRRRSFQRRLAISLRVLYAPARIHNAGFMPQSLYSFMCSLVIGALRHGYSLCGIAGRLFRHQHRPRLFLRDSAEAEMSWIYILSGAITVALVIYLVVALLYPEKF